MIDATIIPRGYRLTIDSWENDADNRVKKVLEGLTREDAAFYVDICRLLSYTNPKNNNRDTRVNNLYEPADEEIARATKVLAKIDKKHGKEAGTAEDVLGDLRLAGENYLTRVCESWKVEYLPEEILMQDVTKEF
jgi:hypothetical protein